MTRIHHHVYRPEGDGGERSPWAGLFILGASIAAWACIVLGARLLWPDLVRLARWAWEALL